MHHRKSVRAFISIILFGICLSLNTETLSIKKVERKLDISTQVVKLTSRITLENSAGKSVNQFHYCLTEEDVENFSIFIVKVGNHHLKQISVEKLDGNSCYAFQLNSPVTKDSVSSVDVELVLTNVLVPFPKSIRQGEKQFMEYSGNHYFFTPYSVALQTTTINLFSPNVLSYSRLKPSAHSDTSITYGPYENVKPFSKDNMRVHFENNAPFLTVTSMTRVIEISHWGNIAVEETIDILHTGALLKGPFSRYDYQRDHNTYSTVKDFKTILPASAKHVYYRDEIGNISTSNMRVLDESVELDLRPRFPLFGGWKTKYTLGYNIPSYEHLFYSGNHYALRMRFLDHVFDDMVVNDLTVKIILPEGVRNINFKAPYDVERKKDSVHYTYLDIFGRTVLTAAKKNLVEQHIQDFELHYDYPAYMMFLEPLLVITAFLILFVTVMIYVRLDFTINKDESVEMKMRVSSYCEMVHNSCDKRAALYEKLENEMQKLKIEKDVNHSQIITKKILSALRDETQVINNLGSKIRADNPDYADKVAELQKFDKQLLEYLQQQLASVEKLVAGRMNKQAFLEADAANQKRKEAVMEKIKLTLNTI